MTEAFPGWDQGQYIEFAGRYIRKRLKEGEQDAINELSAYLGDWLYQRQRMKTILADIEERERQTQQRKFRERNK